jgi:hypothetical protein
MGVKVGSISETFLTDRALQGALLQVASLMGPQQRLLMKPFVTHIASERFFPCVDPNVLCQTKLGEVLLATISAQVLEILLVATDVLLKLDTVHLFATNTAQTCSLVYWLTDATTSMVLH